MTTTRPCCERDHDGDGNCDRHPAPKRVTAIDRAPGTTIDGRPPMRHEQRLEVLERKRGKA